MFGQELLQKKRLQKSEHIGMSKPTLGYEAWITLKCWVGGFGRGGDSCAASNRIFQVWLLRVILSRA